MLLWQVEVFPKSEAVDPAGRSALFALRELGVKTVRQVRSTQLFIVEADADRATIERLARELLADPVTEDWIVVAPTDKPSKKNGTGVIEVHPRPGVMDPVAASAQSALSELGLTVASIRTARRYTLSPAPAVAELELIRRILGNECIHEVVDGPRVPAPPPRPVKHEFRIRHVGLRALNDDELSALSRRGHLFLSLSEMQALRGHFRQLGRDPTDLELETIAQTWSEHCVHKTLKSAIVYRGAPFPSLFGGADGEARVPQNDSSAPGSEQHVERFGNLLRDTIARATRELMAQRRGPECLSVFKDNAGVIAFDERFGIAFKVETHNRPSAIEPYGGAATGVGGCIRDVLGCGLGAKPIANTDVFCVAPPDWWADRLPRGVIHPRTVLRGVVAGVRDYGNRMGIPTVNGAVHFDPRYLGNPLVFCGCVGLIPRDCVEKAARPGDLIVLLGGRTGRDGIHGATFSSAELTSTHADEFSHAVQIGNAIEEKKVLDVVLQARDHPDGCLYHAITDCGAGGLSSAVGEMAAETGAEVDLETVPLKYEGLRYDEIWISESQERMVLAVPADRVEALCAICRIEDVEATVIGRFTQSGRLVVRYRGQDVGDLDLRFLHDGLPKEERAAEWRAPQAGESDELLAEDAAAASGGPAHASPIPSLATPFDPMRSALAAHDDNQPAPPATDASTSRDASRPTQRPTPVSVSAEFDRDGPDLADELCRRLSHPTIASKEWIIRQYDHEVQGRSVIKPLVGVRRDGPADAAVLRPLLDSSRGVAIGCGICPQLSDFDPYWMAVAAIDEAIRNVVCVGGDPDRTAILDNFCWGRTDDPRQLGGLVRACVGCRDAAMIHGAPFISGKDSLNNEFALHPHDVAMLGEPGGAVRDGRLAIPGTLLISAVSLIDDVSRCVTMDFKPVASRLYLLGQLTRIVTTGCAAHGAQPPPVVQTSGDSPTPGSCNAGFGAQPPHEDGRLQSDMRPTFDPRIAARTHRLAARLIRTGRVAAAHDLSDGGLLVAVGEMALAGEMNCALLGCPGGPAGSGGLTPFDAVNAFAECPGCYVVQIPEPVPIEHLLLDEERNLPMTLIGRAMPPPPGEEQQLSFPAAEPEFGVSDERIAVERLREAWQRTLRW